MTTIYTIVRINNRQTDLRKRQERTTYRNPDQAVLQRRCNTLNAWKNRQTATEHIFYTIIPETEEGNSFSPTDLQRQDNELVQFLHYHAGLITCPTCGLEVSKRNDFHCNSCL